MSRIRVLVVGPDSLSRAVSALSTVSVASERDARHATDALVTGRHDVALVASHLPDGSLGAELIRDAVRAGVTVPLVLVQTSRREGAEAAALDAGAVNCLDLASASSRDIEWAIAFAHRNGPIRAVQVTRHLAALHAPLARDGKALLADISGALVALGGDRAERTLCDEVRARVVALRDMIDLVVRGAVDLQPIDLEAPTGGEPRRAAIPIERAPTRLLRRA